MLKDVQTCSNKSYFFDALIIHALEFNTEPITGKALNIAEPVLNRVLKESNFNLNTAIRVARHAAAAAALRLAACLLWRLGCAAMVTVVREG
jgi:hypothetical protein